MSSELHDLLVGAAQCEPGQPDLEGGLRRGRRLRRRRIVGAAAVAVGLAVLGVVALFVVTDSGSPRVTVAPAAAGTPYTDGADRFSAMIPEGWYQANSLVTNVVDPHELLDAATFPLAANTLGPACDAQLPKSAIDALTPSDVFVLVVESHESGRLPNPQAPVDPSLYPTRPTNFANAKFQTTDCSGPTWSYPGVKFQHISFQDNGRVIGIFVASGRAVSTERQGQTWQLLNSLHFDR